MSRDASRVTRGRHSYGDIEALTWGENGRVQVGNFCSIAHGVICMLGGGHRVDWMSTYPFPAFKNVWNNPGLNVHSQLDYCPTKGNIAIGHDVWIGRSVTILSGVRVGHGVAIGTNSVVAKDIPPYAIVVGNPARIIRYRHPPHVIEALLRLQWWNWDDAKINANVHLLCATDPIPLFRSLGIELPPAPSISEKKLYPVIASSSSSSAPKAASSAPAPGGPAISGPITPDVLARLIADANAAALAATQAAKVASDAAARVQDAVRALTAQSSGGVAGGHAAPEAHRSEGQSSAPPTYTPVPVIWTPPVVSHVVSSPAVAATPSPSAPSYGNTNDTLESIESLSYLQPVSGPGGKALFEVPNVVVPTSSGDSKEISVGVALVSSASQTPTIVLGSSYAGTRGQSRAIEGFSLALNGTINGVPLNRSELDIEYMAHAENVGDTPWTRNGGVVRSATPYGRIEGIAVRLIGSRASQYNVCYIAHLANVGDTRTYMNGEFCGTRKEARAVEGIHIWITRR